MTDYLRLTPVAPDRFSPHLFPWQFCEDLIELGDGWIEARKVRIFNSGPALKGSFSSSQYYPGGFDGAPPSPGMAGCEDHYHAFWNENLDAVWSRITREEFEQRFSDPRILDRLSALTPDEEQPFAPGAAYVHVRNRASHGLPGLPPETFYELKDGANLRQVEMLADGRVLRDNLFIQRRRDFAIVNFNGSLSEGEFTQPPATYDGWTPQSWGEARLIDRASFEVRYANAEPKLEEIDYLGRDP